jgi:hypothetical protein
MKPISREVCLDVCVFVDESVCVSMEMCLCKEFIWLL